MSEKKIPWSNRIAPEHKNIIIDLIGQDEKYSTIRFVTSVARVQEGDIEQWAAISFRELAKDYGISRYSAYEALERLNKLKLIESNLQERNNAVGRKKVMYRLKIGKKNVIQKGTPFNASE